MPVGSLGPRSARFWNAPSAATAQRKSKKFSRFCGPLSFASQPGIVVILSARLLAEFGDDPHRYRDAKSCNNYAGKSPVTRASGKKTTCPGQVCPAIDVSATRLINGRSARSKALPGARSRYYDALRARGAGHHAACASRQPTRRHPAWLPQNPSYLRRRNRL